MRTGFTTRRPAACCRVTRSAASGGSTRRNSTRGSQSIAPQSDRCDGKRSEKPSHRRRGARERGAAGTAPVRPSSPSVRAMGKASRPSTTTAKRSGGCSRRELAVRARAYGEPMRKKACIVKRGNSWAVKRPLPDGRYRWQTVGPRKRDAELLRDEINRRVALGALYPSRPQTFAEFVEAWLEHYAQRVRPATLASCRDSLKHLAVFDSWQLDTIRAADVEDHVFAVARRAPRAAELT